MSNRSTAVAPCHAAGEACTTHARMCAASSWHTSISRESLNLHIGRLYPSILLAAAKDSLRPRCTTLDADAAGISAVVLMRTPQGHHGSDWKATTKRFHVAARAVPLGRRFFCCQQSIPYVPHDQVLQTYSIGRGILLADDRSSTASSTE